MKTYTVLYAEDVPHYGIADIEAEDDAAALKLAKAQNLTSIAIDPDYANSASKRIVHIEDESGNVVAHDIALDNTFLRYGGDPERRLCDAAPELVKALREIAEIVLWGEAIDDELLHAQLIETGEYDAEANEYNPSCDAESSWLRDAVETARAALAKAEGGAP